jgi:hypothetical protein
LRCSGREGIQGGFWSSGREKRGPQLKARKAPERLQT